MSRCFAVAWVFLLGFLVVCCNSASGGSANAGSSCGNGKIDATEDCDGIDLGGAFCTTLGYKTGNLSCNPETCKFEAAGCCTDECSDVGDTICQKDVLATCTDVPAGCRQWEATTDCKADGRLCTTSGTEARCKEPFCVDECPTANASQCNGAVVETCNIGLDGCTAWAKDTDCAATGKSCDASSGSAECVAECTDQCTLDASQCSGNIIQKCAQVGECLAWQNETDCTATNEVCATGTGTAACGPACTTNKCPTEGVQTCLNGGVHTCTKSGDGCLDWTLTEDCKAAALLCKFGAGGTAQCQGVCSNPCPTLGMKQCNANVIQECKAAAGNCLEWQVITTCPLGQTCDAAGGTYSCVTAPATGEDCGTALPITGGLNTLNWTATKNNYLATMPSCSVYAIEGPDLVLVYTSPITGAIDFTINKPINQRITAVAASGSCGTLSSQLACVSDYSLSSMGASFNVTQGSTYFFYIGDTAQPTGASLPNPLSITVAEIVCTTFNASGVTFSPAKGSTTNTLSPKLVVDFDTGVQTTAGTITVTGDKGTNLSFTLPNTSVVFTNSNKTMTITPGFSFPAGEVITVGWTGLVDAKCAKPVNPPAWTFTIVTPPCSPGQNGMLGANVTKQNTALSSLYYYLMPDTSPTGYVYFGSTSVLDRISKTGSTLQSVNALAGLSTTHLGYSMTISGNDIFTLDSKTSGAVGWVWRISSDGGSSWGVQDYVSLAATPSDSWDAAVVYKGKLYTLTSESTSTVNTEIWSAPTGAPPNAATLEKSIPGELYCNGLAVDDNYFYLACATLERLIRVHRTTNAVTLLTNQFDLNTTTSPVHADDVNGDGTADYLYFKGSRSEVYVVCNPASAAPYADMLTSYGTSTSSYGLGLDPVQNRLYAWDYTAKQLIVIQ